MEKVSFGIYYGRPVADIEGPVLRVGKLRGIWSRLVAGGIEIVIGQSIVDWLQGTVFYGDQVADSIPVEAFGKYYLLDLTKCLPVEDFEISAVIHQESN